ncbi:hypothetical protein Tco_1124398 [Tanacetum coccineum]|uniref:Uncharacterized protein n=1 Tax=Tanacetum coccineum TaxID=301880 RepID=A0ABQ5J917_9ASTR
MEDTLSKFISESAKRHEENSNLIKEIRASTNTAIRNQGASIKTLEIQIGQMSKVLQERRFGSLPSSTEANSSDQVKLISTTTKADSYPIRNFIILDMPEDIKVPLILERPFLSTARAKIDGPFDLRRNRGDDLMPSIEEGETLVLNRSLDPFFKDYIKLNDLNEPFALRRNQGDDLMPTIEEGEVIEEFRTRDDELNVGIDDYPKFEFSHANFFPLLYVNVMSKKFHNSIMKEKLEYKGNNVVGALINIPIFVGTSSVMTDFAVLENMDAYRDEGMGDVIFGEPFLREVGIKAKRFEGIITIYNGDDEVTYQMVRSHPRFKRHTNEQCNIIPPLLKVSEKDEMNGISHAYQKLKGFYKGVLNLGPDYIRDAKMEEWLTRGHISVHEME